MNARREAAQMEQSTQASAPSSDLTERDLENMKVVLSDLAERLDRFVESFAGDEFSDELRMGAKDLVGVMTEHLKTTVWVETDGRLYVPISVGGGTRQIEDTEEVGGGDLAKAEGEQDGRKENAQQPRRRRQQRRGPR
ncbi:hypothetical protein AB5N19_14518 [Seiridium cardinale]|uniref:Uncharacterized protein n=1 Tax=Seiridium cardinale TaxID=138064 RepID=A0ABR2XQV5_9PEZI